MNFKDYEEAIKKFEMALKVAPKGVFVHNSWLKMGRCYQHLGRYKYAEDCYEKAKILGERLHPSDRELFGNKADSYLSEVRKLIKESEINGEV